MQIEAQKTICYLPGSKFQFLTEIIYQQREHTISSVLFQVMEKQVKIHLEVYQLNYLLLVYKNTAWHEDGKLLNVVIVKGTILV